MTDWSEDEGRLDPDERRWPLAPNDLLPRERWLWWEQLWSDVVALSDRYRLRPGNGCWENPVAIEALAAVAAWVHRYDTGEWDDPPGKLGLLYDLERVRELIRGGEPFHSARVRGAFVRFLIDEGCKPPPSKRTARGASDQR